MPFGPFQMFLMYAPFDDTAVRLDQPGDATTPRMEIPDVMDQAGMVRGSAIVSGSGIVNPVVNLTPGVRKSLQGRLGGCRTELPLAGRREIGWRVSICVTVGITERYQAICRVHGRTMRRARAAPFGGNRPGSR